MTSRVAKNQTEPPFAIVDDNFGDAALIENLRRKIEASLANPEPRLSGAEVRERLAGHHARHTASQRG